MNYGPCVDRLLVGDRLAVRRGADGAMRFRHVVSQSATDPSDAVSCVQIHCILIQILNFSPICINCVNLKFSFEKIIEKTTWKLWHPKLRLFSSFFLVLPAWILVRNTDTDAIWIRIHNIDLVAQRFVLLHWIILKSKMIISAASFLARAVAITLSWLS